MVAASSACVYGCSRLEGERSSEQGAQRDAERPDVHLRAEVGLGWLGLGWLGLGWLGLGLGLGLGSDQTSTCGPR